MRFLKDTPPQDIQSRKVRIDNYEFLLPFASFEAKSPIRILITGGMDGDEYTAIEAAYRLIAHYGERPPPVSLTILPLVNLPGFDQGVSYNPLDGLYPKHIYPGTAIGKPTEQLMYTLSEQYINHVSLWIDLHSGALHESLIPFVWAYQTKREVDHRNKMVLSQLKADKKVYHSSPFQKIASLANKNIAYIMLEAGERGNRETKDIEKLITWTDEIVQLVAKNDTRSNSFSAYTFVDEYIAPKQGLWYQNHTVGEHITKGEVLGRIKSEVKDEISVIKAKTPGEILWQRSTLPVDKGDILVGIGVNKQTFTPTSK